MPNIYQLFGHEKRLKNNRWEIPCDANVPSALLILTNLIDMTYNYTTESGYHTHHFSDLQNIRANTCGFLASHMFAEYLVKMKEWSYEIALDAIANFDDTNIEPSDWYIGLSYSNLAWRQAAVYRDRCTEGDWLSSFNDIYDGKTKGGFQALNKDYIQLRMCAKLLSIYVSNKMKTLRLSDISESSINNDGTRFLTEKDFPPEIKEFVKNLKIQHPAQNGGRASIKVNKRN